MKTFRFKSPLLIACAAALVIAGCAQQQQRPASKPAAAAPAPAPKPAPKASATPAPAPAAAPKVSCTDATWGLIRLTKAMPAEASLGAEFLTELTITAQGCAANVVVRDTVPAGATYVRSEPAATVEGDQLIWKVGNMDAGQTINGKVWLKAEKEGQLVNCATVSADSRVCGSTFVGKPVIAIDKSGPETALLGADVTYNLVVKNTGSSMAKNVVVTDPVPAGMSHSSGKTELSFEVGDLAAGQSKPLAVTLKANQRGKVCNTATANSSNAGKATAEACTVVLVPGLKVEKSGTKEQVLGRNADYEIVVSNTGDTTLNNVVVTDTAPAETSIVAAPGASLSSNKDKATWTIAEIKAGAKVTQTVKLTSKAAGNHCNTVTASAGGLSESAKACTLWKGIAAVMLEAVDDPDPIQVGETTTYTFKITNQGFADIHNVKAEVTFEDKLLPISSTRGTVSGQKVTGNVVPVITPKQTLEAKVTVKGIKVGDARTKLVLTCDELSSPVEESESTTVY